MICSTVGRDLLQRSLHPGTLRVIYGYQTDSCDGVHFAAGLVFGHLIAEERAWVWKRMEMMQPEKEDPG